MCHDDAAASDKKRASEHVSQHTWRGCACDERTHRLRGGGCGAAGSRPPPLARLGGRVRVHVHRRRGGRFGRVSSHGRVGGKREHGDRSDRREREREREGRVHVTVGATAAEPTTAAGAAEGAGARRRADPRGGCPAADSIAKHGDGGGGAGWYTTTAVVAGMDEGGGGQSK